MGLFEKLRGTFETIFSIGIGTNRVQVKNNAGVVEVRDNADSAFVKLRGADPAAANDMVTKGYADSNYLGAVGSVRRLQFVVGTTSASSTTQLGASDRVFQIDVEITTPYSGSGSLDIGKAGAVSLYMAAADINAQASAGDAFQKEVSSGIATGGSAAVLATVSGSPTAGAATITIHYGQTAG